MVLGHFSAASGVMTLQVNPVEDPIDQLTIPTTTFLVVVWYPDDEVKIFTYQLSKFKILKLSSYFGLVFLVSQASTWVIYSYNFNS